MFVNHLRKKQTVQNILRYVVDFLQNTNIAGLQHLSHRRLHWSEFTFWLLMCVAFLFGAVYHCLGLEKLFLDRNVCIDVELDTVNFKSQIPAFTFCPEPVLIVNRSTLHMRFYDDHMSSDADQINAVQEFILRATIASTERIPILNDKMPTKMSSPNMFDFREPYAVSLNGMPAHKLMTDMGVCYNFHSQLYSVVDTSNFGEIKTANTAQRVKPFFDFYDEYPLDFAFTHNFTGRVLIYVHAQNELPSIWTKPQLVINGQSEKLQYTFATSEIFYKTDLINMTSPDTRHCYAPHESSLLMFPQTYSRNLCLMNCRALRAIQLCSCIPHYYAHKRLLAARPFTPICNLHGLNCLASYAVVLGTLIGKETYKSLGNQCNCLPNCAYMFVKNFKKEKFVDESAAHNLMLSIKFVSMEQLRRRLCYTATDYTIAMGSVLSFITGCSLLSFVDILYYCTLRLFWYRRGYIGPADINN